MIFLSNLNYSTTNFHLMVAVLTRNNGDVAQMVERSLSMREVQGSTPCFSKHELFLLSTLEYRCSWNDYVKF
jgi:hypothetical protein